MTPPSWGNSPPAVWGYRVSVTAAVLVAAVVAAFFLIGIADGTVSSFNIGLWLAVISSVGVILVLGHHLHARGRSIAAAAVCALLAVPGVLYALFVLLAALLGARWN